MSSASSDSVRTVSPAEPSEGRQVSRSEERRVIFASSLGTVFE